MYQGANWIQWNTRWLVTSLWVGIASLQGCAIETADEQVEAADSYDSDAADVLSAIDVPAPEESGAGGNNAAYESAATDEAVYVSKAASETFNVSCNTSGSCGANVVMLPVSTHVCALTRVQGQLRYHRTVRVWVDPNDGHWRLGANSDSHGNSLSASARCWPHTDFFGTPKMNASIQRWVSPQFYRQAPWCDQTYSTNTWWSDAATMLSGVHGLFDGGGEFAEVIQYVGFGVPGLLRVREEHCGGAKNAGYAHSYFVGIPGGDHVPKFIGPGGTGNANVAGQYSVGYGGASSVNMADTSHAMCYLTRVSGEFDGSGEYVRIVASGGKWVLQRSGYTYASARCFAFYQG